MPGRLDRAVHQRGLARSRAHARDLIVGGDVLVNGATVVRPSTSVTDSDRIDVDEAVARYVSRAALKLKHALDECIPLGLTVRDRRVLDAGASTGGFTQVLLEYGARSVEAVDVGHGQIHPAIRDDARVVVREGVNVRDLTEASPGAGVDVVVADLSFISLTLVVDALLAYAAEQCDVIFMVKPQFELDRSKLSKQGVVTTPADRAAAVMSVVTSMMERGMSVMHVARSVVPGAHGNVEIFVWGARSWQAKGNGHAPLTVDRVKDLVGVVAEGVS